MNITKRWSAVLALMAAVLLLGLSACRSNGYKQPGTTTGASPQPQTATAASQQADWPSANLDYANTRAATGSTITSATVGQLATAWSFPIPGVSAYGAAATMPIISGNTVYFQDLQSNVYALDFTSGALKWHKDYNLPVEGPNGPALANGRLFVAAGPHALAAIDAETGVEIWSTTLTHSDGEGIDIQPAVYDGYVYVSTVPGTSDANFYAGGVAGIIYAVSAATGDIRWQFNTVDSTDIWGNPQVNSGGGAWYPPAIDTDTGLMYWGIGNPGPYPGTEQYPNGSSRPGPDLYTDSLVALDHATGKLAWYQQIRSHDLFDLDFQASPILSTVTINGQSRKVVIGSGKTGRVVAFDAQSGEILWNTPVGRHQNDDLQQIPADQTVQVYPGTLGGVETPLAYADGVVYVPVLDLPTSYTATALVPGSFDPTTGTGAIVAIDAASGSVRWTHPLDMSNFGGATVANDLLFGSTYTGTIFALDRATGNQVWQMQAPAGINGWPAVSGDTIIIPAGSGSTPVLLALRIGGPAATPAPSPAPSASPTPSPSPAPTATPNSAPTPAPTPTASVAQGSATVNLTISTPDDTHFDTSTLNAPVNTSISVTYTNDSDIPHDFQVFNGPNAQSPSLGATPISTGPNAVDTVAFTTPGPGRYFFYCSVHPTIMTGFLVVQ